jgi:hypothetical protein
MLATYKERRDQMRTWLGDEPRLRTAVPQGAFYLFVDISDFLSPDGIRTSLEFADELIKTEHVVTTAGEAFDTPGFLRLSYAASLDTLREGATRLIRFARAQAGAAANVCSAGHPPCPPRPRPSSTPSAPSSATSSCAWTRRAGSPTAPTA